MSDPEVQKIRNRARRLAEARFAARYNRQWAMLRREIAAEQPQLTETGLRNRALTRLRKAHPYEWGSLMDMALVMVQEQFGYTDGRVTNGRAQLKHRCWRIACPTCQAPVGQPCRLPSGAAVRPHYERLYRA